MKEERMKTVIVAILGWSIVTAVAATGTAHLTVQPVVQPALSLAPLGAARIPFTKVAFTALEDIVLVNGIVVQRNGLSVNSVLEEIMLLDEDGFRIGFPAYLNAAHQAILSAPFAVAAGQTRVLTIAANRPSWSNAAHAGMTVSLSLVGVSTAVGVSGPFPITGTTHAINEGLAIGSVTLNRGNADPGISSVQYVGTGNYTFSAVRITAGSVEPVRLKALRWCQTGSAAPDDLENVKTYVDGVAYDTVANGFGRYYTATFGEGIVIEKGFSKEVVIRGDIVNGAERTVDFDIAERGDLYLTGVLYDFGITPPFGASSWPPDSAAFNFNDYYWYDAAEVMISEGDMTVTASSLVPNQNISVNTAYQILAGFTVGVKGEAVTVRRIGFNVAFGNEGAAADVDDIRNAVLVDENGSVIAGPIDGFAADSSYTAGAGDGSLIFTDAVTFPVGVHTYLLKGRVNTDVGNWVTITISTTPATDFALARGLTTNKSITPAPTSSVVLNTMTVRGPTLTVSFSSGERTAIAGERQTAFGEYTFDTTQSSEDIRIVLVPGDYRFNEGNGATDLTNMQLYDGTTSVTTGSNVRNPSQFGAQTFTLDGNGFIVPKGTVKTISMRTDIRTGISGAYEWRVLESQAGTFLAVGMTSANAAAVVVKKFTEAFSLTVVPHGDIALTQEYIPAISETWGKEVGGGVFFTLGVTPRYEDFQGETLAFQVSVTTPANRPPQDGNGLWYEARLVSQNTVVSEGVLMPVGGGGSPDGTLITSAYSVTFTTRDIVFPQAEKTELRLVLEYDNGLQTGDEVAVFFGLSPSFIGTTSGVRVNPSVPTGVQIIIIRRVPENPVGDVNADGRINAADLPALQAGLASLRAVPSWQKIIPPRQWDIFPDGKLDEWDVAALDSYLKGIFLTLPVGDVNYDWRFSTADIGLTRAGILGIKFLRVLQVRSADINKSGGVTTLDIALMRRLILGLGIGR